MATLTEAQDAYDRHHLIGVSLLDPDVADVILKLEAERDALRAALIRWHNADGHADFTEADQDLADIAATLAAREGEQVIE